jgi:diguanylate cyclase (GGDEF)-like protein
VSFIVSGVSELLSGAVVAVERVPARCPPTNVAGAERPGRGGAAAETTDALFDLGAVGGGTLRVSGWGSSPLDPRICAEVRLIIEMAAGWLSHARDHSELRDASERFRLQSLHDPLTGLPNRALLLDRLEQALQRSRRSHRAVAVMFADLDRFKRVNDLYGHGVGDELLVAFSARLKESLRESDTAGRLSGDEFVVVCEDLSDEADAEAIGSKLKGLLEAPFELSTGTISMTASIGIAFAGVGDAVAEALLEDADTAMYQAKRRGGARHQVLDLRERQDSHRRAAIEHELQGAMARGEMQPHYQPIVETIDGHVVGVEALLRWTSPTRGPIPPSDFIPLAERSGLINEIGQWVLERACLDQSRWVNHDRVTAIDLSVNVSARQLLAPGFAASVARTVDGSCDPSSLVLDITEDVFMLDGDRSLSVLQDLKAVGVKLALDNFGTGQSSLGYLKRFPVDIVKVDRTLIADLRVDSASHAVVYAVAELAHLLGMVVVAEGVETAEHRHLAAVLGCDYSQGFYFGRPVPPEDIALHMTAPAADE